MKRTKTDPKHFGAMRALDGFLQPDGQSIMDEAGLEAFLQALKEQIAAHRNNPARLHGFRIQTMFAYLAAALGGCDIIVEEDAGEMYADVDGMKRPDFRVLTSSGEELFVEVKNFHRSRHDKSFTMTRAYVESLLSYAKAFRRPLFFAIYWSRWKNWTLVPVDAFSVDADVLSISQPTAIMQDRKYLIGDYMVGIPKPLTLRFYTDPDRPRTVGPSGLASFTVKRVAFTAADREIEDAFEMTLAWFFLRYGGWEDVEQSAHVEGGELIYLEFTGVRDDPNPDQAFMMIGALSAMVARQFNDLTLDGEQVRRLSPVMEPERMGLRIPRDFKGKVLGLWRFRMKSHD